MTNDDVLARLRATDPAARLTLSRLDPSAVSVLGEAIMTTDRGSARHPRRRLGRRGASVVGLSLLLAGGGAAYAGHQVWFGGSGDGLNCQSVWNETAAGIPMVGGPDLTGDPIADCDVYREQAGLPPIGDPVAFSVGDMVFVTPRDQVPDGATSLGELSPTASAERELRASTWDWVDGGSSRCFSTAEAQAFARAELDRLDLTGWTVLTDDDPPAGMVAPGMVCALLMTDVTDDTITVLPDRSEDYETAAGPVTSGIRDALRSGIADTCVSLADALAVADSALGSEMHWPTTAITDEAAACSRVDLEIGGSIQVTIHGPTTAGP